MKLGCRCRNNIHEKKLPETHRLSAVLKSSDYPYLHARNNHWNELCSTLLYICGLAQSVHVQVIHAYRGPRTTLDVVPQDLCLPWFLSFLLA